MCGEVQSMAPLLRSLELSFVFDVDICLHKDATKYLGDHDLLLKTEYVYNEFDKQGCSAPFEPPHMLELYNIYRSRNLKAVSYIIEQELYVIVQVHLLVPSSIPVV
jgi:hypothetical protein